LRTGVALRPGDIDIVYVYGYGFPPHHGGPMWYAGEVGVEHVYARICEFETEFGPQWKPSALLTKMPFDSAQGDNKRAKLANA
ncbi:MAG: hypothetical protein JO263_00455, partial [Candidatus Eremiobacteraeota bacterium]|nr:hypothetical protein [Candidatus Eremiobacteraeota bacterium]